VGPRQVGKTALLERTFPDFHYVSLDLASTAEMAETLPGEFLARHPPPLIVDEIQYAPGLFRHLKIEIDKRRGTNGLFVLTGSQNFLLMERVSDSLAGRAAVIPFLGLSGSEWGADPAVRKGGATWVDLLWRGGFPALWAGEEATPDRDRWYQGYVATYLERDVRGVLNVGSLRDFERFLRASAARCGQVLNLSELARDVGISPTTARQWMNVLVASNQVVLLEPYYRSLGKRLVKSPKLHFTDTGLAAFLMGFQTPDRLWSSPQAGALWESYVVGQWLRWRDWHRPACSLWFWRDRSGNEVDLVVEIDQRLVAVECKATDHPGPRTVRGIARLVEFYGPDRVAERLVVHTGQDAFLIDGDVRAVSGWERGGRPPFDSLPLTP
jgi:predicted AAA+ superfamily ATPase